MGWATISLLYCTWLSNVFAWPMVGWNAYRMFDMASFRPGEVTRQFSSHDRANGNDDGFLGTYSCLSIEPDGRCLIAEHQGPGEVASIWFTYEPDSVLPIGDIQIELDGQTVLDSELQSVVNSEIGEPFLWPLVGNSNDTMGGNVIKIPMTFGKSLKVTTENNPHFYHVVYRSFPTGIEVDTFDPKQDASEVLQKFRRFGVRDPKAAECEGRRGMASQKCLSLDAQDSASIDLAGDCGAVSQLQVRIPEVAPAYVVTDDGRAFGQGGGSQMTFQLDPASSKCSITRRVDLSIGHQVVSVSVDGKKAGKLFTDAAENGTWYDQVLELDPGLTKGKSSLEVKTDFVSSDLDNNEFMYALHCITDQDSWSLPAYGPSTNWTLMDLLNVGPNNPHDEEAHSYSINQQTWEGLREYTYAGQRMDEAVPSNEILNSVLLSMSFDGCETVSEVPLGSFFGTAISKQTWRSLLLSVDALISNGAFTSYFPMPFSSKATLTLRNNSTMPVSATVDWRTEPCAGYGRQPPFTSSEDWGYFSIQHHRAQTTPGVDWSILSSTGPGIFYGVTHTIRGSIVPPANDLEFLEGDLQVYINRTTLPENLINDTSAILLGTGTEDFYESGWYYADNNTALGPDGTQSITVTYDMPLTGLAGHLKYVPELGCIGQCVDMHRWMVADSIAFGELGLSVNIEHGGLDGPGNTVEAEYETCAFYYARK